MFAYTDAAGCTYRIHEVPYSHHFSPFVGVIPDGRIWGIRGAVLTPEDKLVWDVSIEHSAEPPEMHSVFRKASLPPPVYCDETWANLAYTARDSYFHWMLDVLPRLDLIRESGIPIDRYVLSYMANPPVELPVDRKVIAYPNGLAPRNGHDTLLAALCILKQQREDFFVSIIGDVPARGELEAFCTANDLERHVQFLGQRPDWPSLLAKTDLVVWPAPARSIPLPLMEAQVAGKAIVALDAGPLRDAVRDGETGLLFSAGSSHQLASSLLRLLDDSLLAIRLGKEAGDFRMRTWSSASWAETIESVYQQAREKRASLRTVETAAGEKRKKPGRPLSPIRFPPPSSLGPEWLESVC